MANTDPKHKEKKSQKRKDRQARRAQKKLEKELLQKKVSFEKAKDEVKLNVAKKKSIPGFMAKNAALVCRWLRDYVHLYDKTVFENNAYITGLDNDQFDRLVQDRIDIIDFIGIVTDLQNAVIHQTELSSALDDVDDIDKK